MVIQIALRTMVSFEFTILTLTYFQSFLDNVHFFRTMPCLVTLNFWHELRSNFTKSE